MKKHSILVVLAALLLAFSTSPAWSQATLAKVAGKITDNGKPVPNVTVVMTSTATARVFKMKTDKNGGYYGVGFSVGEYKTEVISATGETLFTISKTPVTIENGETFIHNIDLSKDRTGGAAGGQPMLTKEQMEAIKAQNAKATNMNALINQAQNALNAKQWQEAIAPLQQMIELDPKRWEFYQALGNAQFNLAQYEEAVATLEKGVVAAQASLATGDPKVEGAKIKAGMGQMLASEGNADLKMASQGDADNKQRKTAAAVAAFTKAAEMDPNPGLAYFNLCATQYNLGQMEAAAISCDKAIKADPNKADAYFIKGSAMYGNGKMDANNKYIVPPGTVEALKKYLELAPDGGHADDVKAMLEALGAKIETSFGKKKK
ncbi:MAG: tetratricopeptide repeat protein [Acidobacteriia bacterium]|nr:tetratricopeptide repeat protein [Terriglobia bacterium]